VTSGLAAEGLPLSGATRVAGVIGSPVRHSLSPALHNAAFRALGLDWVYLAFEVAPGEVGGALAGAAALGIGGLNVTMPHKDAAFAAVDRVDAAAQALASVNTIVIGNDGLVGYSTDGAGFVDSLNDAGVDPAGRRVALLGAGGAARSVVDALTRRGAAEIAVINRSAEKAAACAAIAGGVGRVGSMADVAGAEIVINATSIGMNDGQLPLDPDLLRAGQVVADLVYHPLDTPLLLAARACGATTVDGLGMLVHQAARAFELWTGERPPTDVMRAAAEAELARRATLSQ
jgi:shikimate dehydrogenase